MSRRASDLLGHGLAPQDDRGRGERGLRRLPLERHAVKRRLMWVAVLAALGLAVVAAFAWAGITRQGGLALCRRALDEGEWRCVADTLAKAFDVAAHPAGRLSVALAGGLLCVTVLYGRLRRTSMRRDRRAAEHLAVLTAENERLETAMIEHLQAARQWRAAHAALQTSILNDLGQKVAGLSRELDRPLAVLRALADDACAQRDQAGPSAMLANLDAVAELTARMDRLASQFRWFMEYARSRSVRAPVMQVLRDSVVRLRDRMHTVALNVTLSDAAEPGGPAPCDLTREDSALLVCCEALRLEQILLNLLGNALDAVAAVEMPSIEVAIDVRETVVVITVRDNGPGIPSAYLPTLLFEPFVTATEGRHGLGLALASSIARDCGGSLAAANGALGGAMLVLTLCRRAWLQSEPCAVVKNGAELSRANAAA